MSARLKLLCLVPDLNGGGAERVMLYLVRGLDRDRYDITLALGRAAGPYLPLVPHDIRLIDLGRARASSAVGDVARLLRTGSFDVCYSMVSMNLAAVLARIASRSDTRLVLGARNHYSRSLPAEARFARAKMLAIRALYPRADLVIGVSDGVCQDLVDHFGVPQSKVLAIHNPIDLAHVRAQAAEDPGEPWLRDGRPVVLAAGKLQVAKGYPDLLAAHRRVLVETGARLLILGDGPLRASIEDYIADNGLADDVRLLRFRTNPYAYMARATVFAHAAHWEGFPNVLVEAMACGLPIVSTDCPSGPAEILTHGSGRLVPVGDTNALASNLIELLRQPEVRASLSHAASARVEDFDAPRIVGRYAAAFEAVATRSVR